ncbi:MAG: chorismate synthase [Muribaculaceae bacterium]|nr:chorismate synthase [Muribaculaceae bacterium]
MNTFGHLFRLTDFGESHGPAIGGIIDGMPAGIVFDEGLLADDMKRRRPGGHAASPRQEDDDVEILSGIYKGFTTGAPIGFIIRNRDVRPDDYASLRGHYRPNHADYTYAVKYGRFNDPRGGGRSSARQTACRVVAGAFAKMALNKLLPALQIKAGLEQSLENILDAREKGDSIGGSVACLVSGLPAGIGEPVYGKLHARLAEAMMSINAAHGFEYGDGFALASAKGSEVIDEFFKTADGSIQTHTNHSGGIQGGISNGMPINFRVAFKPTPTFPSSIPQGAKPGRHDPCVALRAVPVVEAMAAITILDCFMEARARAL